eukprot:scaffold123273_cov29-Tisochrysis_lutea.AAC.2
MSETAKPDFNSDPPGAANVERVKPALRPRDCSSHTNVVESVTPAQEASMRPKQMRAEQCILP